MTKYPKKGEIWKVCLDPSFGIEKQGYRPVLVVSETQFNQVTKLAWIVPISNGAAYARKIGMAVNLSDQPIQTTGVVCCDQIRTVDLINRQAEFLETVPESLLEEVLEKIYPVLFQNI